MPWEHPFPQGPEHFLGLDSRYYLVLQPLKENNRTRGVAGKINWGTLDVSPAVERVWSDQPNQAVGIKLVDPIEQPFQITYSEITCPALKTSLNVRAAGAVNPPARPPLMAIR